MGQTEEKALRAQNSDAFRLGLRHGIPIMLGYLAVSFALGISARNAGLSVIQAGIASLKHDEYNRKNCAAIIETREHTERALKALGFEVTLSRTNFLFARHPDVPGGDVMSCALSQKLAPDLRTPHRLLLGMTVTDEMFALSVACPGMLNPWYPYGMFAVSATGWTVGTMLGVVVGNALPARLVSALSVSLFGMFLAAIVPKARENRFVRVLILVSMALSGLCSVLPGIGSLSSGMRVILLTVLISAVAALVCPVDGEAADAE